MQIKLNNNFNIPSPIQKVDHPIVEKNRISFSVKREDQIHPLVSGNKYRKLKYNLQYALENGITTIVTFGGAFSNHIHATAAACKMLNLQSIGIIRGEFDPHNPTLQFARACGMKLHFIDRTSYREKEKSSIAQKLLSEIDSYFIVPEGGSNDLASEGLKELAEEINNLEHDIILVSAGTGGTAHGILKWLEPSKQLWVFSSLKSDHLKAEILSNLSHDKHRQLKFISSYHYGGYGKSPANLISFINEFQEEVNIPLDPIYNAKLVNGFFDMIENDQIDNSKTYLWIHTGGLQGIDAYNYLANKKGKLLISTLS